MNPAAAAACGESKEFRMKFHNTYRWESSKRFRSVAAGIVLYIIMDRMDFLTVSIEQSFADEVFQRFIDKRVLT